VNSQKPVRSGLIVLCPEIASNKVCYHRQNALLRQAISDVLHGFTGV
jgi:hypothetical protein